MCSGRNCIGNQVPYYNYDCNVPSISVDLDSQWPNPGQADLHHYKPHDQWKLIKPLYFSVVQRPNNIGSVMNDIVLDLQIMREPRFHSILFLVPTLLLYLLSPLVFLPPVESGEKTSMSITLLLAQVESMGALAEVLPGSSSNFLIISYFLCISIGQIGLVTVMSVFGESCTFLKLLIIFES